MVGNIELEGFNMGLEDQLGEFAVQNNLEFEIDPFHASTGYEFRLKINSGYFCVGCILGPAESVFYERYLKGRKSIQYKEIRSFRADELSIDFVVGIVSPIIKQAVLGLK